MKKLKAYIIAYVESNNDKPKGLAIVAYSKKEAGDIFVRFLKATKRYDSVQGVVITIATKTKQNANLITPAYYKTQIAYVEKLEARG